MAVGSQDPLHFPDDRVGPVRVIETVRQQNGVNRVTGDRQAVQVANGLRACSGLRVGYLSDIGNTGALLGPGEAQKGLWLAPEPQLQALLAEYPVEGLLDQPGFLLQEGLAERRLEPGSQRFEGFPGFALDRHFNRI